MIVNTIHRAVLAALTKCIYSGPLIARYGRRMQAALCIRRRVVVVRRCPSDLCLFVVSLGSLGCKV